VLEAWFDELDHTEIRALQDAVEWVPVRAGETLYRQGDAAEGMYLVVGGRLRLLRRGPDGVERTVADVGRGGGLGQYGLLADAPRSERAVALRDSHVVRVPRALVARHPSIVIQTARSIVERDRASGRPGGRPRTFAIVPLPGTDHGPAVSDLLAGRLRAWGRVDVLDAATVDGILGRTGAAQAERDSVFDASLTHWLNEREADHDFLVLGCDASRTAWTQRALRQSDVAVLVAHAGGDASVATVEREAAERAGDVELVLVHPDATERPSGTARWLEDRPGVTTHHLRLGHAQDAGRLARRLTGRAHGLVFSGGGARGYAHIGLIRALQEAEVPVDMVAGTSMGAVVAGGFALDQSYEFCYQTARSFGDPKKLLDRTLPLVALNRSKAVTELYQSMYADTRIEDLWTPFFCVSANLTRAEPVVHESGPLWTAVRASSAIPGVFTPLMHEGDLLVDGGVMNNFPVDLMRERAGSGIVIGSNAYTQNAQPHAYDLGSSVSGWKALREKILPFGPKGRYPSMLGTLMRATSLSSKHLSEAAEDLADLLLRYPTEDFGTLDFGEYDALIDMGYRVGRSEVAAWLERTEGIDRTSQAA
jgi:predicted acylesterase/phospholipase RssA